jgi:NAD(P)-dependent dehydrogenase (short-subunit alcohol dehydrogenase family)
LRAGRTTASKQKRETKHDSVEGSEHGLERIEARTEPADGWVQQVNEAASATLLPQARHGIIGSHANAAYHASKRAVRIFSKAAAIQYAPDTIRVNSVHPGFVDTPMTKPGHSNPEKLNGNRKYSQTACWMTPAGKWWR